MFLLSAIFALENAEVYVCSTNSGNVSSDIETSVDKHLGILNALSIPDIDLDNCYVGFGRGLDNFWFGSEQ